MANITTIERTEDSLTEGIKYLEDIVATRIDNDYFNIGRLRYLATLKLVPDINQESRVLDIGTGYGHLSIMIKKVFGYDVYALDHRSNIAERLNSYGIHFNMCDLISDDLPFEDDFFDIVMNCELIEHLFTLPQRLFYEIRRVLKPQGKIILTTPNLYSLYRRIRFLQGKRIIERLSAPGDEPFLPESLHDYRQAHSLLQTRLYARHGFGGTHMREYDTKELRALLNETGFRVIKTIYPALPIIFSEQSRKLDLNPLHVAYRFMTNIYAPWRNQIIILGEKK